MSHRSSILFTHLALMSPAVWNPGRARKTTKKFNALLRQFIAQTLHRWGHYERSFRQVRRAIRARNADASAGGARRCIFGSAARPHLPGGLRPSVSQLLGKADALVLRGTVDAELGRAEHLSQARGSEPHRRAQD